MMFFKADKEVQPKKVTIRHKGGLDKHAQTFILLTYNKFTCHI